MERMDDSIANASAPGNDDQNTDNTVAASGVSTFFASHSLNFWLAMFVGTVLALYYLRHYLQGRYFGRPDVRIDGRVCIVTGSNSGIGLETALELARRGGRVYMACRDYDRCEKARQLVVAQSGNQQVFNRVLDLSSQASIRAFVKQFEAEESRLDILINNAGIAINNQLTVDGYEMIFATNHLGPFLLTNLLLDRLRAAAPGARVVNVSSRAHYAVNIYPDDLMHEKSPNTLLTVKYSRSKLANVLFTRELARRLSGTGITTNSLNPGVVNTGIFRNAWLIARVFLWPILSMARTPRSGAQTTITLALDPELANVSGGYFDDCRRVRESKPARDDAMAKWLWLHSEELTGLAPTVKA